MHTTRSLMAEARVRKTNETDWYPQTTRVLCYRYTILRDKINIEKIFQMILMYGL
jgi:hypothetical protein